MEERATNFGQANPADEIVPELFESVIHLYSWFNLVVTRSKK
jgi:hypothetical protein